MTDYNQPYSYLDDSAVIPENVKNMSLEELNDEIKKIERDSTQYRQDQNKNLAVS